MFHRASHRFVQFQWEFLNRENWIGLFRTRDWKQDRTKPSDPVRIEYVFFSNSLLLEHDVSVGTSIPVNRRDGRRDGYATNIE